MKENCKRQLQAEAEVKRVLIAQQKSMKEASDRQQQEAEEKFKKAEAEAKSQLID